MEEILFHKIDWWLSSWNKLEFREEWEQEIKDFIYKNWFKAGIFEVSYDDENWNEFIDDLTWKIDFNRN